jgi:tRNA dimethylallyltransferase
MEFDEEYRNLLMEKAKTEEGLNSLYEEACKIDEEAMKKISQNDAKRIVRVLEIYKATGKTKTEQEILSRQNGVDYDYKVFVVNMDREKLYERINKRVDLMIEQGLIEEVESIYKKYSEFPTAMQGLGYKEVVEYLEGKTSKEEMIEKIKQESRHYAKRQLTWFRKDKSFTWLNTEDGIPNNVNIILEVL